MKKFTITSIAVAVIALSAAGTANAAPSFNCSYAKKPAERAVCDNRHLGRLDRKLATLYARTLRKSDDKLTLKREQRGWLNYRNRCGYDLRCLRNVYLDQIRFLKHW